ncbi:MAG: hypothetical protein ACI8UO_002752 [Verrucomicrobiales bacterium]|jgi:hypothetical protein
MKKPIFIYVVVWLIAAVLRVLFFHEINSSLWMLSTLVDWGMILAGVCLAIGLLFLKRPLPIATAIAIGGIVWLSWFTSVGWLTGAHFRVWRMESSYEAEVARILAMSDEELKAYKGSVEVEAGPPRRVAFSWGGIIDNWIGVVYDPSGQVLNVDQAEVRSLFGGDLQAAYHLWGPWYYCVFT